MTRGREEHALSRRSRITEVCARPADRSAGSRAASDAAEAQRKIEQARARRAQEQRRQEEARRSVLALGIGMPITHSYKPEPEILGFWAKLRGC